MILSALASSNTVKTTVITAPFWAPVAVLLQYLDLSHQMFSLLCVLVCADLFLGFVKSIILKKTSSTVIWHGVLKKASAILVVLVTAYYGKVTWYAWELLGYGFLTAMTNAEFLSVIKNFYAIRTGKEIKESDMVASIIEKILASFKEKRESHRVEKNQ